MCKFHIIDSCSRGSECPFAHSKEEMRPLPDLTRTKLCQNLIERGVCDNAACTYAHNKVELRVTSTYHKTKLCRFFLEGHCALGGRCNFAHSQAEVREADVPLTDEPQYNAALLSRQPASVAEAMQLGNPRFPQYLPSLDFFTPAANLSAFTAVWHASASMHCSEAPAPPEPLSTPRRRTGRRGRQAANRQQQQGCPSAPPGLVSECGVTSPARIPMSDSAFFDGPAYVTHTSMASPLRSVQSAGGRLTDLEHEQPAPRAMRPVQSANGRLAEMGRSNRLYVNVISGVSRATTSHSASSEFLSELGAPEGGSASTTSSLTPRVGLEKVDLWDDSWQVNNTLVGTI